MEAQMQLARHAKCLFFVKKVIKAWFEYFATANQICFVLKRYSPKYNYKNELDPNVDGGPFVYGLDGPYADCPVVACGRLPPSSGFLSGRASEEGAGDLQRRWMNDLYLLCADDEGRDLLRRTIPNLTLFVRALPLVAMTTDRELVGQEFGTAAFLVSLAPWPNYCVRGDRNGDSDRGRRANEPRRRKQGGPRKHNNGQHDT